MGETSIQWTDRSVNPIRARLQHDNGGDEPTYAIGHFCQKISPGCANCYASRYQRRRNMPEFKGAGAGTNGVEPFFDASRLHEVLKRRKPTKWFWCDMTDLFGDWVPDEWIDQCFAVMALRSQHTHQVLTKRPERMLRYLTTPRRHWSQNLSDQPLSPEWWINETALALNGPETGLFSWPLPNVWLGTSVEDQTRADERIPLLLRTPAAVRFLSVEPLLGAVDLTRLPFPDGNGWRNALTGQFHGLHCRGVNGHPDFVAETCEPSLPRIHWVIVGGESGPHARPCRLEWVRDLVRQCREARVPVFVKQLGSQSVHHECPGGYDMLDLTGPDQLWMNRFRDSKGGDPAEWSEDLRVRQFPETPHAS